MKIGDALPEVVGRAVPIIEPDTQIFLAVSQLLFHEVDALPIGFKAREQKRHAIFGYSCLNKLVEATSDDYRKYLDQPCVKAAQELTRVKPDDDIESFLFNFKKSGIGYTWIESKKAWGFASLLDSLDLYSKGMIEANMTVGQTASPIFSLPGETKIDVALQEMFDRKLGRVFVEGKDRLLTDRRIIGKLFSAERLALASKKPKSFLDLKLADIAAAKPLYVKDAARIKVAALSMKKVKEETLVCEKGVVTPWDLLIKPLETGKLDIKV